MNLFKPVKLRHYLKLMEDQGFSTAQVLAEVDLKRELLHGQIVRLEQYQQVVRNMIALTGDQGIGLEMGLRTDFADLGLVGHALMASRTLREAIECWIHYSLPLVGVPVQVHLEENAQQWALRIDEPMPLGFLYNFCVEECLVIIAKLGCEIAREDLGQLGMTVEVSYPAPAHVQRYRTLFGDALTFNAPATRVRFASVDLDQPLPGSDAETYLILSRQCRLALRQQ